jgi:hypothetical protein
MVKPSPGDSLEAWTLWRNWLASIKIRPHLEWMRRAMIEEADERIAAKAEAEMFAGDLERGNR